MNADELKEICLCGETTTVQFKREFTTPKKMAEEMVAMANSRGGRILIGVEDKTGEIVGLSYEALQETSRELGTTANDMVKPTIFIETEVVRIEEKHIIVCTVKEGKSKPYKTIDGTIWVKQGADKRRITENSEILSLFQISGTYQPDLQPIQGSSIRDIDTLALDRFFDSVYHKDINAFGMSADLVLRNIHVIDGQGQLTTAGMMFFGRNPQRWCPSFVIKAVWFYGTSIAGTSYHDSRDIEGTIPEMFDQAMMWLKSCLNRRQEGQSFNSIGELEVSEVVLEELLQNALIHLDLLKPAAIRLLVFDDRIEIINPGCLPGNQTIEEVKLGNSFIRNKTLAGFCVKAMPYRGLGSGIPRVLAEDSQIDFIDSKDGNQFTARIWRTTQKEESTTQKTENTTQKEESTTQKNLTDTQKEILEYLKSHATASRKEIADEVGNVTEDGVKFILVKLQRVGLVKRVGGRKFGHWEVIGYGDDSLNK